MNWGLPYVHVTELKVPTFWVNVSYVYHSSSTMQQPTWLGLGLGLWWRLGLVVNTLLYVKLMTMIFTIRNYQFFTILHSVRRCGYLIMASKCRPRNFQNDKPKPPSGTAFLQQTKQSCLPRRSTYSAASSRISRLIVFTGLQNRNYLRNKTRTTDQINATFQNSSRTADKHGWIGTVLRCKTQARLTAGTPSPWPPYCLHSHTIACSHWSPLAAHAATCNEYANYDKL